MSATFLPYIKLVVEAYLDKGKGYISTILVQSRVGN